jgi:hypothetical protein
MRALAVALLVLLAFPAGARIVQTEQPPAAESGGRAVPPSQRGAAPRCTWPSTHDAVALLVFDACYGLSQQEFQARVTAANRLLLESLRGEWRAPRLSAKAARARARALRDAERRHDR